MQALDIADLWSKGTPPVAGGTLDQTGKIVEATRFIWSEQSAWEAHFQEKAMRNG